jgi:hypothetical protein
MATEESRRTLVSAQHRTRRRSEHAENIALATMLPREEIERRAYELYLARGGEPGQELEDWLRAERELTQQKRSRPRKDR